MFECGDGAWTRFQGNLTWAASQTPPLEFKISVFHRLADEEEWTAEADEGRRTTLSPMPIDIDLTRYPGDVLTIAVSAWYVIGNDFAGVLVTQGEPFTLEGNLTCAS